MSNEGGLRPGKGSAYEAFDPKVISEKNFMTGGYEASKAYYDPLVTGYAFLKVLKLPTWMEKNYPHLRQLMEKQVTAIDGIANQEINVAGQTEGFGANELPVAQGISAKPNTFNTRFNEMSGSILSTPFNHWVSSIRDPQTNVATYPKIHKLEYALRNHSATLLFIHVRPDADNFEGKIVEKAMLIQCAFPKTLIMEHWNWQKAQQNTPIEITQAWAGIVHFGAKVEEFAIKYLKENPPYEFTHQNDAPFGDIDPKSQSSTQ